MPEPDHRPLFLPLDSAQQDRSRFFCGIPELDRYLKQYAGQDQKRRFAAPYTMLLPPDFKAVVGFYTLSGMVIGIHSVAKPLYKKIPYPDIPAILMGRLALDQNHQGKGLREMLLLDALFRCAEYSRTVAAWAVVVDAVNEPAKRFYRKFGFQDLEDHPMRLYMAISDIEKLFG